MAANKVGKFILEFDLKGLEDITGIEKSIKRLGTAMKGITDKTGLPATLSKLIAQKPKTISAFKAKISTLQKLRNEVDVNSRSFKNLGKSIEITKKRMKGFTDVSKKASGIGLGAKAAGGAALGSVASRFLPAGAATGASLGYLKTGTIAGGAAGAAIGLGVDAAAGAVSYAADAATYASEIEKLRIALKGVTKDQSTFDEGLRIISETSKKLNVPIAASTKQFTTLAASVLGSGGTIKDAEEVFTGVSNAIKATGGNAEDVQSAIRAMSQIFGKGKVSAEELQGQLGERLAGAVVKFAEANGSSLQKLQKDLRDGTVGLDQVIKFAKKLNVDFADTAIKIANSSADAGQRLKVQMDNVKLAIGESVLPIGAAFQKAFGDIAKGITESEGAMNAITGTFKAIGAAAFATFAAVRFLTRSLVDMAKILYHIANLDFKKAFDVMKKGFKDTAETAKKDFASIGEIDIFGTKDNNKINKVSASQFDSRKGKPQTKGLAGLGDTDKSPLKSFAESAFKFAEQAENAVVKAFKGMEDAMVKFVLTGKLNFKDLANSIIADLTRMLVRAAITKPLFNFIFPGLANGGVVDGGEIVNSAKGNVFAKNKIVPYAKGGVVTKPTLFPMANGMGLMGEAGPESVMPLKRGRDGKLGVIANGGGVGNIVVNVDACGSSVEANETQSAELGKMLGAVVQAELIRQKRPGGLLN